MFVKLSSAGLSAVIFSVLAPMASAEEQAQIKLGAHAFLDYENVEAGGTKQVDGTNVRLFRVDVSGSQGGMVFKSNFDLQGEEVQIRDLFVDFKGDVKFRVGSFKVMNGLEQASSLYATTFAEANSVTKINGLGRKLGVGVFGSTSGVEWSFGAFGADVNDIDEKDEWSVSGRASTELHPLEDANTVHLGLSYRHRENSNGGLYSYGQKPFAKSAPTTVKTPGFADSDDFLGLEAVYLRGGFSLQSEYGHTSAHCAGLACSGTRDFDSFYLDISQMWGGERVLKKGLFSRTKVKTPQSEGGMGAFALSARYDVAELEDGSIDGGRQDSFILGGTWYRDKYIRVLANYVHSELEDSPSFGDESADSFVVRFQAELY